MKYFIPAGLTVLVLDIAQFFSPVEPADLGEVIDGDTVDTENETIRFLGVDTPETYAISENNPSDYRMENSSATKECLDRYGETASNFVENSTSENIGLIDDFRSDTKGDYGRS